MENGSIIAYWKGLCRGFFAKACHPDIFLEAFDDTFCYMCQMGLEVLPPGLDLNPAAVIKKVLNEWTPDSCKLVVSSQYTKYLLSSALYIMLHEVKWEKGEKGGYRPIINNVVYRDTNGNQTIGIGFNMNRTESEREWKRVFNYDGGPTFARIMCGRPMNIADALKLYLDGLRMRRKELDTLFSVFKKYQDIGEVTDEEIKRDVVLTDIYYQHPTMLRRIHHNKVRASCLVKKLLNDDDAGAIAILQEVAEKAKNRGLKRRHLNRIELLS